MIESEMSNSICALYVEAIPSALQGVLNCRWDTRVLQHGDLSTSLYSRRSNRNENSYVWQDASRTLHLVRRSPASATPTRQSWLFGGCFKLLRSRLLGETSLRRHCSESWSVQLPSVFSTTDNVPGSKLHLRQRLVCFSLNCVQLMGPTSAR
jgi:hypothetical protein